MGVQKDEYKVKNKKHDLTVFKTRYSTTKRDRKTWLWYYPLAPASHVACLPRSLFFELNCAYKLCGKAC